MSFPKPIPIRREKSRHRAHVRRERASCVEAVWQRAGGNCEACGIGVLRAREAGTPFRMGHVHEQRPRSLGGDPTDPNGAILLCARCHMEAHRLRVAGVTLTRRELTGE